ncbi:MAG: substrate-binding domain-containing protein, partial [Christensenellales bacterium]
AGYLSLKHNFISADNYAAGMFAAQTFIGLGHRDIAFVGEKRYAYSFAERCNGFVDEAEKNRNVRVYTVQSGRVNDAFDLDYMKEFIAEHGEVSAYFCANDSTALALHYHLDEINVKVPEEVSIIGFDNLQAKSVMRYNFTTFEVNQKQIARETVKVLVDNIRNGTEVKKSISVNTIFLKGKTVAEYKPR